MYLGRIFRHLYEWYLYLSILKIQKIQPLMYLYLRYISTKVYSPILVTGE